MIFDIHRDATGLLKPLTPRQEQVAQLLARGLDLIEIAETLGIVYNAAQMHVNAIADKLPNPHRITPLKLARQWAIAREFARQGREMPDITLAAGEERDIAIQAGGRSQVVRVSVDADGQVCADIVPATDPV